MALRSWHRLARLAPSGWVLAIPVVVAVALAALQMRWVGRLRDADVTHVRQVVRERTEGIAWDVNHELARAYDWFSATAIDGDRDAFAARHAVWQRRAPQPRLFRAWYLVTGDRALHRFDAGSGRFTPAVWTAELAPVHAALAGGAAVDAAVPFPRRPGPELADPAALLIPLASPAASPSYALGLLDVDFVLGSLVPMFARGNLGDEAAADYDLEVRRADSGRVLLASPRPHPVPDFEVPMFRVGLAHLDAVLRNPDDDYLNQGLWRLRVTHREGSIAAFVAQQRRRDVIIGAAVLGLLAASLVLLLASARRAQRLAAQQLAFVAGVTHELRTPLAVIRSAAENLADGVVDDPDRVRRYGQLLLGEGVRLSRMVEHAIAFAALESGARAADDATYDVAAIVSDLVAASPGDVTAVIEAELPAVRGDPAATRLVLDNVVENARKHAPGAPIAIRVAADGSPRVVRVEIADQGPGIDAADVPHLFEPFYRGQRARDQQVPGSGLGLSIVKRLVELQRGTIAVRSQPGAGVSVIVHLPAGA
jgi:signal transduction histidine kinase